MNVIAECSSALLFWVVWNLVQNSAGERIVGVLRGCAEDQTQLVLKAGSCLSLPWAPICPLWHRESFVLPLVKEESVWIDGEKQKSWCEQHNVSLLLKPLLGLELLWSGGCGSHITELFNGKCQSLGQAELL